MRIAHLPLPSTSAGTPTDRLELAQAFVDLGHDVVVLTTSPSPLAGQNGLDVVDHVVATSDRGRARLASAGVPERKIAVVPPAVDADGYELTTPVRDALRSLLRVADRRTVGVIADLSAERDLQTLVEAVAQLEARGTSLTLLLIGDGPERAGAEESIEARGEISALFPGAVPEEQIPAYLAAIDVAVAPSASGADFPDRRLFQYLAAAVPVVAAETP